MSKYKIPQDAAHQIAVGLYRQVGQFVAAVKQDNPDNYEHFKAAYLAKQDAQIVAPVKRHHSRSRSVVS